MATSLFEDISLCEGFYDSFNSTDLKFCINLFCFIECAI